MHARGDLNSALCSVQAIFLNDTFKLIKDTLFLCVIRDRAIFIIKETKGSIRYYISMLQNISKNIFLSAADYFRSILSYKNNRKDRGVRAQSFC